MGFQLINIFTFYSSLEGSYSELQQTFVHAYFIILPACAHTGQLNMPSQSQHFSLFLKARVKTCIFFHDFTKVIPERIFCFMTSFNIYQMPHLDAINYCLFWECFFFNFLLNYAISPSKSVSLYFNSLKSLTHSSTVLGIYGVFYGH